MKNLSAKQIRGPRYRGPYWIAAGATMVAILFGANILTTPPSFAAGTSLNSISVGGDPLGASAGGFYIPKATATSKDAVVLSVDATSVGCSLSGGKVNFTGAGECVLDFNDAGNAGYEAAQEVTQNIKVYAINTITPGNSPTEGSVKGYYSPLATATSGDVVQVTLAKISTGCTLAQGRLAFLKQGTCQVELNDPGNGAYAAAKEVTQKVTIYVDNLIRTSTAPKTAAINSTYDPSASASSRDAVVITLDATSTGCAIVAQRITFTSNGSCRVDFNDAGNGAYATAKQVQQTISVGTGGPKAQAELYLSSLNATKGTPLTLTSSGGTGSGAVTYSVVSGSSNCSLSAGVLSAERVGTCLVTVAKEGDVGYLAARSQASLVDVNLAGSPRATRVTGDAYVGRSVAMTIIGSGFYGLPSVVSGVRDTKIAVSGVSGSSLRITVTAIKGAPIGVHTLTLRFSRGQKSSVLYTLR